MTKTLDDKPMDLDMTFISKYEPKFGIKVCISLKKSTSNKSGTDRDGPDLVKLIVRP